MLLERPAAGARTTLLWSIAADSWIVGAVALRVQGTVLPSTAITRRSCRFAASRIDRGSGLVCRLCADRCVQRVTVHTLNQAAHGSVLRHRPRTRKWDWQRIRGRPAPSAGHPRSTR